MDININGNPGTGNTFQEIHINYVQNFNPNATTVVNYNNGDKPKAGIQPEQAIHDAERTQRRAEIMAYVARLKDHVAREWQNRYDTLWTSVLDLPEVDAVAYLPGKQKNASFNRNLIANIIYIMCCHHVFATDNATTLTVALEGDKDHPVRAKLRDYPEDSQLAEHVEQLFK